ncbi:hypothetical protein B0H19DRAFT_1276389 [Mycena capillaripes]|nr:hypothetical protein B0H19DRAFT_1276386 [Mycena capillaripes]KAJ6524766.1 hypothetical protein B0H19DRAFT_1276389 [Mycena capillaripes]
MSTVDKEFSLILPPPVEGINSELASLLLDNMLPVFNMSHLSDWDEEGVPDPRILIALGEYVYDVSKVEVFGPNKLYCKFAGKDISCALVRFTYDDEQINMVGHSSLSSKELDVLK